MSVLDKGRDMYSNQCLVSPNEKVALMVESDGRIALYKRDNYGEPAWQSTITPTASSIEEPFVFKITDDNNIAVYDIKGQLIWKTNVSCVDCDSRLVLEDDGRMRLHAKDDANTHIWSMKDGSIVHYKSV